MRRNLVRRVGAVIAAGSLMLTLATGFTVALLAADVAPAAAQDDGLLVVGETTYRVDSANGWVDVEVRLTATNQVPTAARVSRSCRRSSGVCSSSSRKAATNLQATNGSGSPLTMTKVELSAEEQEEFGDSVFESYEIDFGPNLFYRQTREVIITFRLPDGEARDDEAWARVNPAIASFPVVARGDGGRASGDGHLSPGFEITTFGNDMERSEAFGGTILSVTEVADTFDFFVYAIGFSDTGLERRSLDVDGLDNEFTISSWPGDEEWDTFVADGVIGAIPILQEGTGVPWPLEGDLEVKQTVAPQLAGYGGWFYEPEDSDGDDATIEVGEGLDIGLLGHEIAHAWFNGDFADDRWITEGFAEYFGVQIARALDPDSVVEFDPVTPSSPGSINLDAWFPPSFFNSNQERELYGYSASYQVISALAEEIGEEALAEVVSSMAFDLNPYDTSIVDEGLPLPSWRRALDAFELVGGSEDVEGLFRDFVLGESSERRLLEREEAQTALAAFDEIEPNWEIPPAFAWIMARWNFPRAEELIEDLEAQLARSSIDRRRRNARARTSERAAGPLRGIGGERSGPRADRRRTRRAASRARRCSGRL